MLGMTLAYLMSMDTCLSKYKESFCFGKAVGGVVLYREYAHCRVLHFSRGVGEFVSIVCTMFYLTTMVYDLKVMRQILIDNDFLSDNEKLGIEDTA